MSHFYTDLKYSLRQLVSTPGSTIVVIVSLALGIGANTAIFSVINGVLLRSLPVPNPQDLRVVGWKSPDYSVGRLTSDCRGVSPSGGGFWMTFPYPTYRDFAEHAQGFSHIFGFSFLQEAVTIRTEQAVTTAHGLMVSGNFFAAYSDHVLIGRSITEQDDQIGADPVAVITYLFWQRYYELNPHVLGQSFMVNDTSFTIIGVLPKRYQGPLSGDPTDFYVPLSAQPKFTSDDSWIEETNEWWVRIMGRLEPETSDKQAHASLESIFHQSLESSEAHLVRPEIILEDGRRGLAMSPPGLAAVLKFLQTLVAIVLLVACVNVANLLLARGAVRRYETAIRTALGAGRWRLIRQSLAESLILSLGAIILGPLFSVWIKVAITGSMTRLIRELQGDLEYMSDASASIHLGHGTDGTVLLFTIGVGFITTLLFGLIPALRASHVNPSTELKVNSGQGTPRLRLGRALITVQIGLSMLLITGAVLLTRTMVNLHQVDPGYDMENLLTFRLNSQGARTDGSTFRSLIDQVRSRIAQIPGVKLVALSCVEGGWYTDISVPEHPEDTPEIPLCIVSEGWFKTMGIPLVAGRDFDETDVQGAQEVAIVNKAFVRTFLSGKSPLGRLIDTEQGQCKIVGLCANHRLDLREEGEPIIYYYSRQNGFRGTNVMVRSVLPALSLVPAVRKVVSDIDPDIPLEDVTTRQQQVRESLSIERTLTLLCISLALLTLGLCCIGLYGLTAYSVTRRIHEIGIRMALGARSVDVAKSILREAALLTVIGIAIGLPLSFALSLFMGAVVYGFAPYDPMTLLTAGLILLLVSIGAAWIPARRAAKVDPMEALRYE